MKLRCKGVFLAMFFLVFFAVVTAGAADFQSGVEALNQENYRLAFDIFSTLADQGNAKAQRNLGVMYYNGEGVTQDYAKAVYWFKKAAAQGNAKALYSVGFMYYNGKGVTQDYAKAVYWYRKAAAQGVVQAQCNLGAMYYNGEGVAQDYSIALKWAILAAAQEKQEAIKLRDKLNKILTPAQVAEGQRMARNFSPRAETSAVVKASVPALTNAEKTAVVSRPLVRKIQQHLAFLGYNPGPVDGFSGPRTTAAIKAFQRDRKINPDGIISESLLALLKIAKAVEEINKSTEQAPRVAVTGTAFLVSSRYAVTNYHVVKGAKSLILCIADSRLEVSLIAHDSTNDLALIKLAAPFSPGENTRHNNTVSTKYLAKDQTFARFRDSGIIYLGEQVMVAGYPLRGYLSSGLNVSMGEVSALSGPGNNNCLVQISAPVQQGNSGGPLLDKSGLVIGIVVAKLNAVKFANATGDIPQNVNFAVKGALVKSFLDVNGISYAEEKSGSLVDSQAIARQASGYTFPLECYQ